MVNRKEYTITKCMSSSPYMCIHHMLLSKCVHIHVSVNSSAHKCKWGLKALCHNHYSYNRAVTNAAVCAASAFVSSWVCLHRNITSDPLTHIYTHTHTDQQYTAICHYNEIQRQRVYLSVVVLTLLNTQKANTHAYFTHFVSWSVAWLSIYIYGWCH